MKKLLALSMIFYSSLMSASFWKEILVDPIVKYPLSHAGLAGVAATLAVQKIMGKESEDTLFIGCESRVNCDQIVVSPFEDGKIIVTVGLDEKVGIGLAGNFIGFRTGKFADEVNHENKKAISNNDKKALTAGVVTGV